MSVQASRSAREKGCQNDAVAPRGPANSSVQDLGCALERDANIFVSLIARDLRFVHTLASRELGDRIRM
jgi:hypothetical protein